MAGESASSNSVARRRIQRQWSQSELARRAGIPRTSVSAIEGERLTPSVLAALALARVLECSVEELFGGLSTAVVNATPAWAWMPRVDPHRYWEAEVGGRRLLYPVEALATNGIPHDGVWRGGLGRDIGVTVAETTLVLACCDPAAGLLAAEYARATGFRLIVFSRGGGQAIELLKRGLVHVAGLHRSTIEQPTRNAETVRTHLPGDYRLVHVANWQEGLAFGAANRSRSPKSVATGARRWALREAGSAARECLEELRPSAAGRTVRSHAAVAEAVRGGWADAGICVQLSAEEAGLSFLPVRTETLDFCFPVNMQNDARLQALVHLLRSRSYRRMISDLPGYDARHSGELHAI